MTPIVFNYFCKKLHLKSLRWLWKCLVLIILEFWVFISFCKYGRVLNMCLNTIMKGFQIFQDSEYIRFLHMQAFHKVLNMPEYALWQGSAFSWAMFHRILNRPPVVDIPGLRIWCLNMREYALIMLIIIGFGHFDKHFVKNKRKRGPAGKLLYFFLLDSLKTTSWMKNLTQS